MTKKIALLFFLALIFRFFLVFAAYHGDLNNNISWGTLAVERGLVNFYENPPAGGWPYSAPNQPPLTILMFASLVWVWKFIHNVAWWLNNNFPIFYSPFIWFWESRGMTLLVKLPSIFADLGIACLIYRRVGFGLSAVWLFNPVVWYNSTIWGQTDSVVNFLGLAAILFLLQKKLVHFAALFTASLLFKGSLAIFAPILFFFTLWQKHALVGWVKAGFWALIVVVATSVWFHPSIDLIPWLASLYQNRILPGEIGFLTANAFNFWWLVDPGRTLDSAIYFGLPARIWGFLAVLGGIAAIIWWLRKRLSDKAIFYSLITITLIIFLFMTRIHERYLYPFFPYATLLLGFMPSLWIPYLVLSATHLLNLYHLFWAPSFTSLEMLYANAWFAQALSIINMVSFVLILGLAKRFKV